jgi:hypothetical protein
MITGKAYKQNKSSFLGYLGHHRLGHAALEALHSCVDFLSIGFAAAFHEFLHCLRDQLADLDLVFMQTCKDLLLVFMCKFILQFQTFYFLLQDLFFVFGLL